MRQLLSGFGLLALLTGLCGAQVLTQHNDNSRSGANLSELTLNTLNVNVNQFGKLFSRSVDGQIYAQPLYVPALTIGGSVRNVVYVATEANTLYAFDADNPAASTPLWQVNLGTPVPDTAIGCEDVNPTVGITATPVIDMQTGTIYVSAKTTDSAGYHHKLHALDLLTGSEKFGGPIEVAATVAGIGAGSVNGTITFNAKIQHNRPGLVLSNGTVYLGFGAHCDLNDYHGWLFGFARNTSTGKLTQTAVFLTTPNGSDAGIWQAGQGPATDHKGNLYVVTGNGTFDQNNGLGDYGDTILKLSPSLQVLDYFTPGNQSYLNTYDKDLGSSGLLLLPHLPGLGKNVKGLAIGGGKQGVLYVVDQGNLGTFGATDKVLQEWTASTGQISGTPVFWQGPNGMWLYIWGDGDHLRQYAWANGRFATTAAYSGPEWSYFPAGILALSANGSTAGTGIIWSTTATASGNWPVPGILHAYDASNVSKELWNSYQNQTRDDFGNVAKFCPPTVANGKVYMATFSNQLVVYGLLPH